jgi:hypothetical protein
MKPTNEMTDDQFIHTVVMRATPEHDFAQFGDRCYWCKCAFTSANAVSSCKWAGRDIPAYSSPDSPRRLLDEVEKVAIERFGGAAYERALITAMVDQIQGESLGAILATAPADVRCRAIRSLYEGEGK